MNKEVEQRLEAERSRALFNATFDAFVAVIIFGWIPFVSFSGFSGARSLTSDLGGKIGAVVAIYGFAWICFFFKTLREERNAYFETRRKERNARMVRIELALDQLRKEVPERLERRIHEECESLRKQIEHRRMD